LSKEYPILFSAPMVRSILAGTKTHTRRVVKGMALEWLGPEGFTPEFVAHRENGMCPYGQPGERLWVRETWAGSLANVVASADPREVGTQRGMVAYRATYAGDGCPFGKWRPSIHMPRWASRITLEITGVRVERLQEISQADVIAEGCVTPESAAVLAQCRNALAAPDVIGVDGKVHQDARHAYRALWESINGPGSWDANPWVWVVAFRRLEGREGLTQGE